ncbi:hypothetical protein [Herbaspirillum rhizosphaerae]|uniref:hypothetical protein n=1 Tax=Herbaspirillum rhizosphaerae TaxID=346179 RepID=UPI00067D370B|nr:hypothetical protein [Herbaspirillum rhizosphaerae]
MQAIERNPKTTLGASHRQSYVLSAKEGRFSSKAGKSFRAKEREDDCSMYDKLPKQIDDIVEGESPKRFKRPKMDSDIVAR